MYQVKEEQILMVTEEELKSLEAQGGDVSMYREVQKKAETFSITMCKKLDEIAKTPRNPDGEVVKAICKPVHFFEMLLKKKAYVEAAVNAPLIYGRIVQAHNCIFEVDYAGKNFNVPAVLVFAVDEKHRTDAGLLKQIADKLSNYKQIASKQSGGYKDAPDGCSKIIGNLIDVTSQFCLPVPESLAGDAEVWCATCLIADAKYIPYKRAPKDRLLPFIMKTPPNQKQRYADLLIVSGDLYRENY